MTARPHVAYLVAAYPAVSHTFIEREIVALRACGLTIDTFSIRRAPESQLLSAADRAAAADTFAVLPVAPGRLIRAHLRALSTRPGEYVATLAEALRMSAGGLRAAVWQLFYFVEAIVVWEECRRRGIDHIHAHFANVASAVALLAARFGRRDQLGWSFTMHGPTEFEDVSRYALADKVARASFVACISDFCRSQLLRLSAPEHWDKLVVVRCGLDPAATTVPAPNAAAGPVPRVLCVGRLVPEKGQLILLRAVAELRRRGLALALSFVGDGPDRAALQRAATELGVADAVTFHGALGQQEIGGLYAGADVFCLPSFAEGLPVVLMEAMAHWLPVVTTRIAGVGELVSDEVSGLLVAPGREDLLADALQRLITDDDARQRLGRAGHERVARDYVITRSAETLARQFARG